MTITRFCLAAILAVSFACQAHAQCEWEPSEHVSDHLTGVTYASLVWDPDGPGPAAERLIAGGDDFLGYVMEWEGRRWSRVGAEVPYGPFRGTTARVYALAEFEGDLIAAGRFEGDTKPLNRIARFDGEEWTDLAGGFGPGPAGSSSFIRALAVYKGDLYAAGSFLSAGGTAASNVARWDGAAWHPLGAGTDYTARTLTVWDGKLVVGGEFREAGGQPARYVATWDGDAWGALADAPLVPRFAAVHDGDLYLGTDNKVVRWTGAAWDNVGESLGLISSLASVNGMLLIEGRLPSSGGGGAAYWDGGSWVPLGDPTTSGDIHTFTEYEGDVIAMGQLAKAGEHFTTRAAGRWTGETWRPLGDAFNSSFADHVIYESELVLVGTFTFGDGARRRGAVRWNGEEWLNFPTDPPRSYITEVVIHDGQLVIGGAGTVYQWDGATWQQLGAEFEYAIHDLLIHRGDLYAGGAFVSIGGAPLQGVARWDGERWIAIGASISGTVFDMTVFGDDLYAAGNFIVAGVRNLARWDGDVWTPVPNPVDDQVRALAVYENDLIVGGWFTGGVMRWHDGQWEVVGEGFGSGNVEELYVHDGALYAAGGFTTSTGVRGFARWDGAEWVAIAEGASVRGESLSFYNGHILASGSFEVDGSYYAPYAWARCETPCYADCDGSGSLDFFDFLCFQNQFAAGDPAADCDDSGELDFFDFLCFQNAFAAGCQ